MIRKQFAKFIFALFSIISYILLWFGFSNVVSSFFIYCSIFLVIDWFIIRALRSYISLNWQVFFWSLFISILILELGLRYATDNYKGYGERNGNFSYSCPYSTIHLENAVLRFVKTDLRLFTQPPNWELNDRKPEFSFSHSFNSLGLRDTEPDQFKIDSNLVVVGLGDSFTEGVGTTEDSTWVRLLQNQLNNFCQKPLITVNGGRNGSDLIYEAFKLEHLIVPVYNPDLVVFAINSSDINDLIVRGEKERFVSANQVVYRNGPWWKYLYSFSYVWRVIAHEILGVNWSLYSNEEYLLLEDEAEEIIHSTIINEILPFTESNDIQTLFVFTPMEYELDKDSFAFTELSSSLRQDGINVLNLHKDFSKYSDSNTDYYWDIDLHCNSQGYLLWSKAIGEEIRKQGLMDCN